MDGDIKDGIRRFVLDDFLFGDESGMPQDDASLLQHGVIDSTGVLILVSFLEDRLGIVVADDDIVPDNFDSINNLTRFACSKLQVAA